MSSQGYFDSVASQWDAMRSSFFSEDVRRKAFRLARIHPGRRAADIGAGSGFITEGLLSAGLSVIAVDQSESMQVEARRKFGNNPRLDYRLGIAEQLPLEDASVDYAFANMYLHHVDDPPAAIREMTRLLKPGGRLVITDLDEHDFEFLRHEHHDRWMGFKREDVLAWLQSCGLKRASVSCIDEDCCATSASGSEAAQVSIFLAYGEKGDRSE